MINLARQFNNSSEQTVSLVPLSVHLHPRRLESPIKLNSESMTLIQAPVITEYLDTDTGEIISAKEVHDVLGYPIDLSLRALQRETILDSLRAEIRAFAVYVLSFRNRRRGITPDIHTLVKWYAEATHRRIDNVKRNVPTLKKIGLLASDFLLCPIFQLTGQRTRARDHLSEEFHSDLIRMKWQRKLSSNIP